MLVSKTTTTEDMKALERGMEYNKPEGFDKRVEIFDPKTGALVAHQPYSMTVTKSGNGVDTVFERNGVQYYADGSEIKGQSVSPTLGEALQDSTLKRSKETSGKKSSPADAA